MKFCYLPVMEAFPTLCRQRLSPRLLDHPFNRRRRPLDAIFAPRNVAVIGATEASGSVWTNAAVESGEQPIWGNRVPREFQARQRPWNQGLSDHR